MSLFAASYIINDEKTKFVTTTLARTGTNLKPEVHIGTFKDEKVIISHDNWKEFSQHFNHFTDFIGGKLKQHNILLVADHHLTYVYSRYQFGKSYICVSQIRRNSEEARCPTTFCFSRSSWGQFAAIQPLIESHLEFITTVAPIVCSKIVPALAGAVFRLGGITKDACTNICAKSGNFNTVEFHVDELRAHENERIVHEILMFNNIMIWDRIFESELALA
jgi:hypothetical protein